jgi:hypothetical protein
MNTAELTQHIRDLTKQINERYDQTPNLRDYWPDVDAYKAALEAYEAVNHQLRISREIAAELREARRQLAKFEVMA